MESSQLVKNIKADMEAMGTLLKSMEARGLSIHNQAKQLAQFDNVDKTEVSKVVEDIKKINEQLDEVNGNLKEFNDKLKTREGAGGF